MPKISSLTPKKLLKILLKNGFEIDRITGSHYILYCSATRKMLTLPFHCKDLPKGTAHSILKAAGISLRDIK